MPTDARLPFVRLGPHVSPEAVTRLVARLTGAGWVPARILCHDLACSDRTLRAWAAASDGRILSGQAGYHLTATATPGDVAHAVAWLRSQASQMTRRANQIAYVHQRCSC